MSILLITGICLLLAFIVVVVVMLFYISLKLCIKVQRDKREREGKGGKGALGHKSQVLPQWEVKSVRSADVVTPYDSTEDLDEIPVWSPNNKWDDSKETVSMISCTGSLDKRSPKSPSNYLAIEGIEEPIVFKKTNQTVDSDVETPALVPIVEAPVITTISKTDVPDYVDPDGEFILTTTYR